MDLGTDEQDLRDLLRSHGVEFALVFGSRARGDARPDSDLDLAVMAPSGVAWTLDALLGDGTDVVDLATAPESLRGRIAVEGEVLLDDDPAARVRWQAQWRKRWADEAPRRARFNRDFADAHG